jgi:L-amino acid N-acyltransferase YncA
MSDSAANITVRRAAREDVPGILEIYNDAVLNTAATADYEPQALQARLEWYDYRIRLGFPIYVAEDPDSRIVGWASLSPYHNRFGYRFSAEVSVYVAADMRGKGIGKMLLPALIEGGKAKGLHTLIASIDGENEASIRLHERYGFVRSGHLKQVWCKFGRWLDVVYLQLILNDSTPGNT